MLCFSFVGFAAVTNSYFGLGLFDGFHFYNMESDNIFFINLDKMCRICLCETKGLISIFDTSVNIEDIVNIFADVQSCRENGLSCHICPACFEEAIVVREFKRKCEASNLTLSAYFCNIKKENPLDIDLPDDYVSRSFDLYDNPADLDKSNICDQSLTADFFKYDCAICEDVFPTSKELTSHILEKHNTLHSCDMCNRKFDNTFDLIKHQTTHKNFMVDGNENMCPICKDDLEKYDFLQRHMNSHIETSTHHCKNCNCYFTSELHLRRHKDKLHFNEEKLKDNENSAEGNDPDRIELLSDFDFLDVEEIKIEDDMKFVDKIEDDDGSNFNITNLSDDSKLNVFIGNLIEEKLGGLSAAELGQTMTYISSPILTTAVDNNESNNNVNSKKMFKKQSRKYKILFECHLCIAQFKKYIPYRNHLRIKHELERPQRPYMCSDCGKSFNMRRYLIMHLKYHKPIQECAQCFRKFRSVSQLTEHVKGHAKGFLCMQCGKIYSTEGARKLHIVKVHGKPSQNDSVCNFCNRKFKYINNLHSHLKTHIGADLAQLDNQIVRGKRNKKLYCDICGHYCTSHSNMVDHMRRHMGQVTCKCDFCGKGFQRRTDLNIHLRSHTGERPYACKVCCKTFLRSDKLSRHMKMVHTGERPFVCRCGKVFAYSYDVTAHMKRSGCKGKIEKVASVSE